MYWINAICSKTAITPKTTREPVLIHFIDQFSSSREELQLIMVLFSSYDMAFKTRNKLYAAIVTDSL